jgi:hypothetical protein
MKTNNKLNFLLTALLIAVFAVGSVGVGIAVGMASNELQVSVLSSNKVKKTKVKVKKSVFSKKLNTRLVADAASDGTTVNPVSCAFSSFEGKTFSGEFINVETNIQTDPGQDLSVSLFLKNTGNAPWFSAASGCSDVPIVNLGTALSRDRRSVFYNPGDPSHWLEPNRIAMAEPRVNPGEIATFTFLSHAPTVNDIFKEYFQPVVEGKQWMESKKETAIVSIKVGQNDAGQERKAFYLNYSGQASALDISGELTVEVNLTTQKTFVKFGDNIIREYLVSTGKSETPTPIGKFKLLIKQDLRIGNAYPHYRMPYFQGFTVQGAGFHALPYLANDRGVFWNEALSHLGQRVSHGCVRMADENAEDLFKITELGTPVVIHY